eukprot:TRINITY_DN39349_c0_g1_i1.p1 TRINITY_DN39349_c0_g1~~TRINITY_DN39349_c0_g1_i1.p1  ORF type:complete len:867 (+),score=210.59 TRINITY_DN39349_c0_g1_i1:56-2656(+)
MPRPASPLAATPPIKRVCRRWESLLAGVPAADVPLGSTVTLSAKGQLAVAVDGSDARRGYGVLFAFGGGGGELHLYEGDRSTCPLNVVAFRAGSKVRWADASQGEMVVQDAECTVRIRCDVSCAHVWYASVAQLLRTVCCDDEVLHAIRRLGLPASYAGPLAQNGFEAMRFLKLATVKELRAIGVAPGHARALITEALRSSTSGEVEVPRPTATATSLAAEELGNANLAFKAALYSTRLMQCEAQMREARRSGSQHVPMSARSEIPQQGRMPEKAQFEAVRAKLLTLLRKSEESDGSVTGKADELLSQHVGYEAELLNSLCAREAGLPEGDTVPRVLQLRLPDRERLSGSYLLASEERQGLPVWMGPRGTVLFSNEGGRWIVSRSDQAADRLLGLFVSDKHYGVLPHAPFEWLRATKEGWRSAPGLAVTADISGDVSRAESQDRESGSATQRGSRASSEGLLVDVSPAERALAATPPPRTAEWQSGDRVQVRDDDHQNWEVGVVEGYDSAGQPLVLVEGWDGPVQWRQVRRAEAEAPEAPAAAAAAEEEEPQQVTGDAAELETEAETAAEAEAGAAAAEEADKDSPASGEEAGQTASPAEPAVEPTVFAPPGSGPPPAAEVPALLPHLKKVMELYNARGWKREVCEKHKGREALWESLPVPWSPIHAGRFSTVIECPMKTLINFIQVPDNMKLWDKALQKVDILEHLESPGAISLVTYMAMKMPMITGRDMVSLTSSCLLTPEEAVKYKLVRRLADGGQSEGFHRTGGAKSLSEVSTLMPDDITNCFMVGSVMSQHKAAPITKKYERASAHAVGIIAVPVSKTATRCILLMSVDPGGKLPAWAVNVAQRDQLNKLIALKKCLDGKR